jgi:hypothetical protein
LRRRHPTLSLGSYRSLNNADDCFIYLREHAQERFLIVLNFTDEAKEVTISELGGIPTATSRLSTHMEEERIDQVIVLNPTLHLRPNEGVLIEL